MFRLYLFSSLLVVARNSAWLTMLTGSTLVSVHTAYSLWLQLNFCVQTDCAAEQGTRLNCCNVCCDVDGYISCFVYIIYLVCACRLMVNLTQPAILCFQNHVPTDKATRNLYMQVEGHLQAYKEAFSDENLFGVLTKKLGDLLQLVRLQIREH